MAALLRWFPLLRDGELLPGFVGFLLAATL
jgi:hypothetical protein